MSATTTVDIMKALLRRLRAAEPEAYTELVQAMDLYAIEIMQMLAQAPQDQVLNCQGRAQQCQAFLRMFSEAHLTKAPPPPAP
jgi:hypothetical protein